MKKLGKSLLLLIVGSVVAWQLATPTYTYRYRLTVEVNTPEGVKSGSSVIQVSTEKMPDWLQVIFPDQTRVKGEAVFVDLGKEKHVIAVLAKGAHAEDGELMKRIAPYVFHRQKNSRSVETTKMLTNHTGLQADVDLSVRPTLVTFADMNDPLSVKVVDVAYTRKESDKKFSEVYGEGYSLKRVWVEMTDKPATHGVISKRVTGLKDINRWNSIVREQQEPDKIRIGSGNLIRENW